MTHAINHQRFEFTCGSEERAARIIRAFGHQVSIRLNSLLESILDELVPPHQSLTAGLIEIDLGDINAEDFGGEEMMEKFSRAVAEQLRKLQPAGASSSLPGSSDPEAAESLEITGHFLSEGVLPWWVARSGGADLDRHMLRLLTTVPERLRKLLEAHSRDPMVAARIRSQYKGTTVRRIAGLVPGLFNSDVPVESAPAHIAAGAAVWAELLAAAAAWHKTSGQDRAENRRRGLVRKISGSPRLAEASMQQFVDLLLPGLSDLLKQAALQGGATRKRRQEVRRVLQGLSLSRLHLLYSVVASSAEEAATGAGDATDTTGFMHGAEAGTDPTLPLQYGQTGHQTGAAGEREHAGSAPPASLLQGAPEPGTNGERSITPVPFHPGERLPHLQQKSPSSEDKKITAPAYKHPRGDDPDTSLSLPSTPAGEAIGTGIKSEPEHLSTNPSGEHETSLPPGTQDPHTQEGLVNVRAERRGGGAQDRKPVSLSPTRLSERERKEKADPPQAEEVLAPDEQKQGISKGTLKKASVARLLGKENSELSGYIQELSPAARQQLEKALPLYRKAARQKEQLVRDLLKQPHLLAGEVLPVALRVSFPDEGYHEHSYTKKGDKAAMAVLDRLREGQRLLRQTWEALPASRRIILQNIVIRKEGASRNEVQHLRTLLRNIPAPALGLLHFVASLPEPVRQELQATAGGEAGARPPEQQNRHEDGPAKLYVTNGGLCLVAPYLPGLFGQLGYLEDSRFRNGYMALRALHLLHYLATGERKAPEYQLPLCKLLCGLPQEQPPAARIRLTRKETDEADECLQAVIGHWKALKNTTVLGFRAAFLQRNALLFRKDAGWILQVEKKEYDLLLNSVPWNFTMIKLAWMEKMLQVEWRN